MAAGDTFRAGAIEQLEVWGERVGVDVIKQSAGSDPAAVMFDAIQAAKSEKWIFFYVIQLVVCKIK